MANVKNRILSGSTGNVWIAGNLVATIKNIELKITGQFEEQTFAGDYATYNIYTGWSGEGSMTWGKFDSTAIALLADAYKTGVMPEVKITTKLTDKATGQSERVAISDVIFTEFFLAKFEAKTLIDEELPLKFSNYDVIEKIK